MQKVIVGHNCNKVTNNLPKNPMVAHCEKCRAMIWLDSQASKLKKENDEHHYIWCWDCVEKADKSQITVIDLQKSSAGNEESFTEKLSEEEAFAKLQSEHDQQMRRLEEWLPSMLSAAIARLKIWSNLEDLSIAMALSIFVDDIFIRRRESLGMENVFDGFSEDQIETIMRFVLGVAKAVRDCQENIDNIDFPLSDEIEEYWNHGWEHWKNGYHGNDWGNTDWGW